MLASSSGLDIAARAALTARPSPDAYPMPISAVPASFMIMLTSAKSVLMSPGVVIRSVMPCTPWSSTSSHILNALSIDVVLVGDLEQAVVRDHDERVDLALEPLDAVLGLDRPPPALERERPGHDADGERADAAGDLGDDRRAAGAGAAALARGDEDHVGALEHLLDLVAVLLGRLAAHLGVGAGAETAGELAPDVELHVGVAHQQRLRVGVDRDELHALEAGVDHAVDGVAATAADADDLDDGQVVLHVMAAWRPLCSSLRVSDGSDPPASRAEARRTAGHRRVASILAGHDGPGTHPSSSITRSTSYVNLCEPAKRYLTTNPTINGASAGDGRARDAHVDVPRRAARG